jgi:glycosyltransferase involved in cell wall biosynthesis
LTTSRSELGTFARVDSYAETRPPTRADGTIESIDATVHLVGRMTDTVFSFLGPATAALAQQGVSQTIVLIDDPLYRHLLPKFHESVRLVLTPADLVRGERLKSLLDAYVDVLTARRPSNIHVHGFQCLLLGLFASRFRGVPAPTYYSPHGSKSLGDKRGLGSFITFLLKPLMGKEAHRTIANIGADARRLSDTSGAGAGVELIESPIGEAFFETPRKPLATPLIITASRMPNPLGAAQFAQCAVLLSNEPGLKFCWIGTADSESVARLKAAGVELVDLNNEAARAQRMAEGWVYMAPDGDHGFPVFLAEAMALGLPAVAWDTSYHRDIVRDGDTAIVCKDGDEALQALARLLESRELRSDIGAAAQTEARSRFDGSKFRESLLRAYGGAGS